MGPYYGNDIMSQYMRYTGNSMTSSFYNPGPGGSGFDSSGFGQSLMNGFSSTVAGLPGAVIGTGLNILGNYINTRVAERAQNRYMEQWGSPQAQMRNMTEAGINPYAAAGMMSGAAGSSNVSTSLGANDGSAMATAAAGISDSMINPTVASNLDSQTRNNNSKTQGQDLANQFAEKTLQTRINQVAVEYEKSGFDRDTARIMAEHQEEISDWTVENMKKQAANYDAEIALKEQQKDNLKKQLDVLNKEIEEMDARISLMSAQEAAEWTNVGLIQANARKTQLEGDILAIDKELEDYGGRNNPVAYYSRMKKNLGEEVADAWLNDIMDYEELRSEMQYTAQAKSTPQGRLALQYETEMNNELAAVDKQIQEAKNQLSITSTPSQKVAIKSTIETLYGKKDKIRKKYRNRMRRINKGSSGGFSVAGTGVSAAG